MASYHDVIVYVDGYAYRPSQNYALDLTCCKSAGWQLWRKWGGKEELIGEEFGVKDMCIAVDGLVILGQMPARIKTPDQFGWTGGVSA
jgi:hypothetical protein